MGGGDVHSEVSYARLVSLEHLFGAWDEFRRGKEKKADVRAFAWNVEDNLFALHERLISGEYQHGAYYGFFVRDPKLRRIHKASVADRVLHHALHNMLQPAFERQFIFDLYSNRTHKGTHRAFARMQQMAWRLSRNNTRTVWALKCDVRKFFDGMDHDVLLELIFKRVSDPDVKQLINGIVRSYSVRPGKGLPLGNLTSQLFSNVYLDPLDQWAKHVLRARHYIRYVDDFILLSTSRDFLARVIPQIARYLSSRLKLELHPDKIILRPWHQGIDFLGYVGFPCHVVLRTKTARRMFRKVAEKDSLLRMGQMMNSDLSQVFASYEGLLSHCRSRTYMRQLEEHKDAIPLE